MLHRHVEMGGGGDWLRGSVRYIRLGGYGSLVHIYISSLAAPGSILGSRFLAFAVAIISHHFGSIYQRQPDLVALVRISNHHSISFSTSAHVTRTLAPPPCVSFLMSRTVL